MSRQLKFRAWFEGHIYEVAKLDFWGDPDQASCDLAGPGENGEWEELFNIYVGEVELMQYTGLKDKNGKEIWEGDVVVIAYEQWRKYTVEYWETGWGSFVLVKDGKYFESCVADYDALEVIGNIHDKEGLSNGY